MAGIIKRDRTASAATFSFRDLDGYAKRMLAQARAQADAIVASAQAHAADKIAAAHQEALERGRAEGRAAGHAEIVAEARDKVFAEYRAQLGQLTTALDASLQSFEQEKRRLLAASEHGVIQLALAIARRVCKVLPEQRADVAVENVRHVLETVGHTGDPEVRLNPADLEAVQQWAAGLAASLDQRLHLKLVADPAVDRGGCQLVGQHISVDAALATQLDRIAAVLCAGAGEPDALPPSSEPPA